MFIIIKSNYKMFNFVKIYVRKNVVNTLPNAIENILYFLINLSFHLIVSRFQLNTYLK